MRNGMLVDFHVLRRSLQPKGRNALQPCELPAALAQIPHSVAKSRHIRDMEKAFGQRVIVRVCVYGFIGGDAFKEIREGKICLPKALERLVAAGSARIFTSFWYVVVFHSHSSFLYCLWLCAGLEAGKNRLHVLLCYGFSCNADGDPRGACIADDGCAACGINDAIHMSKRMDLAGEVCSVRFFAVC